MNDLAPFFAQAAATLRSEYERIQSRAVEDPGTAGDQGEENWAEFLRNWLPPGFDVVTKGRIVNAKGDASRQLDVLVLLPSYPPALKNKKLYLAAGVAAAFECKTTLKKKHVVNAIERAAELSELLSSDGRLATRNSTPYKTLHSPIVYGVLAHSHSWSVDTAVSHITGALAVGLGTTAHPRDFLDLVCVADLGAWFTTRSAYRGPNQNYYAGFDPLASRFPNGYASCIPLGPLESDTDQDVEAFTKLPVGQLCAYLTSRLAWEHPESGLRPISHHFRIAGMFGQSQGRGTVWDIASVYEPQVAQAVSQGFTTGAFPWDEWGSIFL